MNARNENGELYASRLVKEANRTGSRLTFKIVADQMAGEYNGEAARIFDDLCTMRRVLCHDATASLTTTH
jgi:hypothetical protein